MAPSLARTSGSTVPTSTWLYLSMFTQQLEISQIVTVLTIQHIVGTLLHSDWLSIPTVFVSQQYLPSWVCWALAQKHPDPPPWEEDQGRKKGRRSWRGRQQQSWWGWWQSCWQRWRCWWWRWWQIQAAGLLEVLPMEGGGQGEKRVGRVPLS